MNKWTLRAVFGVLLLWLLSGLIQKPIMEESLTRHTQAALSAPEHRGVFADVKPAFDGQQATLTGTVGSQALREQARDIVTNKVRPTGEWGESYNPVTRVIDQMRVDPAWLDQHPQQYLIASYYDNHVELLGWVKTAPEAKEALTALEAKYSGIKCYDRTRVRDGLRAGSDWATTLKTIPDLRTAEGAAKTGSLAFSAVDGKWTTLPGTTTDDQAVAPATAANLEADPVQAALGHIRGWVAREAENERIAKLPPAYVGVMALPDRLHVYGHAHKFEDSVLLVDQIKKALPGIQVEEHVPIDTNVKPGPDWQTPLKGITPKKDTAFAFALAPGGKASTWDTTGGLEGMKKALSPSLPADYDSYPDLYAAYEKWAKAKEATEKAAKEAAAKALQEKQAAEKAAEKAAKEAAEKAAMAAKTAPAATTTPAPAAPALPGFIGWTLHQAKMRLFGQIGSDALKTQAIDSAKAAFPGTEINADALKVSPTATSPAGAKIDFAKPADAAKPAIGLSHPGGAAKVYNLDVFDSEIERDFPAISFPQGMLGTELSGFRTSLVSSKLLQQDEPYVSAIATGTTLTVSGEVADEAAKKAILDAMKAANPTFTITDALTITPLVTTITDTKPTLESAPKFEPGKGGIAVVTPGQKWRTAVVHSIRFKTGSNRSKDQERALYQVRRVLKLNPAAKFEVAGHSDNVGDEAANTKLSETRAKNVADGLAAGGIDRAILSTRGAGPREPVADPNTDAGRALNRRVDVLLK